MIKAYINKINGNTKFYKFDNIDDLKNQIIYTENLTKQIDNIKKNYYQLKFMILQLIINMNLIKI
jgi:hypothetical protein